MIELKKDAEYKFTKRDDPSWVIEGYRYSNDEDNGKLTFYGRGGNVQFRPEDFESEWIIEEV